MLALDLGNIVQALLFLLFADLTALVAAVIGPTYDQLLVPELSPGALYPSIYGSAANPQNFLAPAAHFSEFLVASVVDPAIALVGLGVALLYLARAVSSRWAGLFDGLLPRLVLAVVGANFAVPIGGAILGLAGSLYPVVAGWDGGAWQHWQNLAGVGEIRLSWDNGVLAFVLSLVEFAVVFALVLAVGVRDALLAVLLVLLPVFSLVWPFRPLSSLARRAWLLFVELAFLPCVTVVPLELAVGSPTPVILIAYLGAAVASPFLLSIAGTNMVLLGFPSTAGTVGPATQRALSTAPSAPARFATPALSPSPAGGGGALGRAVAGGVRAAGSASAPMAPPLAIAELVGHGAAHLARHIGASGGTPGHPPRVPPLLPGGPG
jgi:hypothetical protein